jgi:hypothetical protein
MARDWYSDLVIDAIRERKHRKCVLAAKRAERKREKKEEQEQQELALLIERLRKVRPENDN